LLLEEEIFSLKFTKYRLAAGLRPDPLGELKRSKRSPDPLAAIRGPTSKGRGREGRGREGREREERGEGREEGKGRGRVGGNLLQGVKGDRRP